MRNTFVKLFLALALCFMVGCALVACGGEFTLSVSEDGYIMVNGEKTDIKQGDSLDDCKHEVEKAEVKAHTADADGVVLEVCTKCDDYAKVSAGTIHNYADGEVAATCTDKGFKGQVCTICGAFGEGEATEVAGHKWGEDVILTSVGTACVEGGVAVKHCSACKAVSEPAAVKGVGHVVAAGTWVITTPPGTGVGTAEGDCQYCDQKVSFELPALNDEDYATSWKDGKAPTCYDPAQKVYKYIVKNEQNNDKVWDKNIDCEVTALPDTAEHILAGKPVDTWFNATKKAYNFYADVNGDGVVEAVGFKETANAAGGLNTIKCEEIGAVYYTCEACNYAVVEGVKAYKAHFGSESVTKVATCNTAGTKTVACVNCLDINPNGAKIDYYADHTIKYTLEKDDTDPTKWNLVGKCEVVKVVTPDDPNTETDETVTVKCFEQHDAADYETYKNDSLWGYYFAADVPASKVGTTKSTCYQLGYDTYKCETNIGGVAITITAKVDHDPNQQPKHTLGGKLFNEYKDGEIDTNTKGILPTAGGKFEECGKEYDACYHCEVCVEYNKTAETAIGTLVVLDKKVKMPHSDVEVENAEAADPTCLKAGKKFVKCVNTLCTDYGKVRPETINPLGHDYVGSLDVDVKDNELTLKANCSRGCKEHFAAVEKTVALDSLDLGKGRVKVKASCVADQINSFSGTLAFKVVPEIDAVTNGYVKDDVNGGYKYDVEIVVAVKKDKGVGFVQSEEIYDFVTINYEKVVENTSVQHVWCEEDAREVVVFERDWDKDGVIDAVETYTFQYCVNCFTSEQLTVEIDQLTEVTEAPKEEDEE